ncbi:inhibitory synaptic factor 1 [Perognathus longimembris pacificus]|uniref:inhibitory synaptic factor 1 n=1 Tax=Perognathus longimembris pacificus TaxID=214514 RepID=UPI002018D03C|nr:inhibitory synaptic factor 1 [Perognathus longimembris pacificus]
MNSRGAPDLGQPRDDPHGGERERIRQRMKMVIGQLEDILRELKEVAKELREVVTQIDRLTSDFDFELEPEDWTTATVSSTSSSDKAGTGGPFDFTTADILSDSWEFCSFLDLSSPPDSAAAAAPPDGPPEAARPGAPPDYRLMNGSAPVANGPRVGTPDSWSEEAFHAGPGKGGPAPQRTPGTRERVRFSDKVLYHALCCDDEEEGGGAPDGGEDEDEEEGGAPPSQPARADPPHTAPLRPSPASHKTGRRPQGGRRPGPAVAPEQTRRGTRNSSTQTVADKGTQTPLPYAAPRQKAEGKN